MTRALLLSLSLWSLSVLAQDAGAVAAPAAVDANSPDAIAQKIDKLYEKRDDEKVLAEMKTLLEDGLKAHPNDYGLLWRASRHYYWLADGVTGDQQKALGKQGWDFGDRAMKANPSGVEGVYFSGISLGAYSTGAGVVNAISQGLEGKFNERVDKAMKLAPEFNRGGPVVAKGRYHSQLPWPKRDLDKSAELLQKVIKKHPENLRAYLYLAETQLKDGEAKTAKETLSKVFAGSTAYDPPEARRVLSWARKVQAQIEEELK